MQQIYMRLHCYWLENVHFLCLVSIEWARSTAKQSNKCWHLTRLQFMSRQSWIFYCSIQNHVPKAEPKTRKPLQTGLVLDFIPPNACLMVYIVVHCCTDWVMFTCVCVCGDTTPFWMPHKREPFSCTVGEMTKIHLCLFLCCGVAFDFRASTSPCTHCFRHLQCKQMKQRRG